jgi:hypothetical protein
MALACPGRLRPWPWPCLTTTCGRPKRGSRAINFSLFGAHELSLFQLQKKIFHFFFLELSTFHFLLSRAFNFSLFARPQLKIFHFFLSRATKVSLFTRP